MRRTEFLLRQLVREASLNEKNSDRIYQKILHRATLGGQDAATVSDTRSEEEVRSASTPFNAQVLNTSYRFRDADKRRVSNEKEMKRIWAEEVKEEGSRSFFDQKLIKVHWVGGYRVSGAGPGTPFEIALKFIKSQPRGRSRDEISCFGYTPEQGIDHKPTPVGVIIKGYTTYASAVDAGTHMTSRATDVERRKHSGSGLHKRPLMGGPSHATQNMIVDEESWATATRTYHEVIVDNWTVGGIIIPSFQGMIDSLQRKLAGIGKERKQLADQIVDEARRDFQELGRLAAQTGIPFYDENLEPIDFSGEQFSVGELESEWNKVLTPSGGDLQGTVTGDPGVPEVVVEGRTVGALFLDSLPKPITFRSCEMGRVDITNMGGSLVKIENCKSISSGVRFESGEGSIEVVDPVNGDPIVSISQNFKLRKATFTGCNFRNRYTAFYERVLEDLQKQRDKNGAIITFINCENLPPDVEGWENPPAAKQFYYHGPGREGVTQLSADDIAKITLDVRSFDHKVYVDGSWRDAFSVPEVQDSFKRLVPPPPSPSRAMSEALLRRIVREEVEAPNDRAIVVIGSTFAGPVYVVAYDRWELERAVEHERARNPIAPDPGDYFGVIAGLTLKRNDEYGECNGAWRVTTAASNERGWGTKVYLAAFEWLRNISSDRTSVSRSAEALWKSLARKGIIEPEPFDDRKNPQTPPTSDDCKVFPSRDPVLNSSFRINGSIPPEVSQLLDSGDDHLRSFGGMRPDAEKLLRVGIGNLFVSAYDG